MTRREDNKVQVLVDFQRVFTYIHAYYVCAVHMYFGFSYRKGPIYYTYDWSILLYRFVTVMNMNTTHMTWHGITWQGNVLFCLHVYILISWKKRKSSSNGNGIEIQEQQDLKKMWEKVFGLMDEIDGKEERIEECLFG